MFKKENIHPIPHQSILTGSTKLDVITMISNPVRYNSRYKLFEHFRDQNQTTQNTRFWVVEVAYANRPFIITERDNPFHIQLRTYDELWHKENALNVGIQHISQIIPDFEYVAWVDADVTFSREDWAYETIQQLQHYDFVQMFSHAQDLGPKYEPISDMRYGWMWMYYNDPLKVTSFPKDNKGFPLGTADGYYGYSKGGYWHPGFAWAAKRSALDKVGGLIDTAILGSGDWHMASALIGQAEKTLGQKLSDNYKQKILLWQGRAERSIKRNVGYVHGLLNHHWHGKKKDRNYSNRWKVLTGNDFRPDIDLRRDTQGLWALNMDDGLRSIRLRDDIRSYFRARDEDSIDLS